MEVGPARVPTMERHDEWELGLPVPALRHVEEEAPPPILASMHRIARRLVQTDASAEPRPSEAHRCCCCWRRWRRRAGSGC